MARPDDQKNFCFLALLVKFNQANSCKKSSLISKPLIFFFVHLNFLLKIHSSFLSFVQWRIIIIAESANVCKVLIS